MKDLFQLKEHGTDAKTEFIAEISLLLLKIL